MSDQMCNNSKMGNKVCSETSDSIEKLGVTIAEVRKHLIAQGVSPRECTSCKSCKKNADKLIR